MGDISGNFGAIRESMGVVSLEGQQLGEVTRIVEPTSFHMTNVSAGCAFERVIPFAWISQVGDYVFLSKSSAFVAANARRSTRVDPALGHAA